MTTPIVNLLLVERLLELWRDCLTAREVFIRRPLEDRSFAFGMEVRALLRLLLSLNRCGGHGYFAPGIPGNGSAPDVCRTLFSFSGSGWENGGAWSNPRLVAMSPPSCQLFTTPPGISRATECDNVVGSRSQGCIEPTTRLLPSEA